ncbi:MAG: winged helix-turn-helix transcriptional regulator [Actinobacteria bacterium]|nr:winged helix-turn-helix transcriptional regulator [Actinomycetota bacterium]
MTMPNQSPPIPGPQLDNVDHLTVRVFQAMGRLMHLHRLAMQKMVTERGVQPPEMIALSLLRVNNGATQSELGGVLHLSPPRVSTILSSLEESGAVVRRPDEADRRLTRVFLTAEGRRREEEHRAILSDFVEGTIGALSEADRRELERLLGELAERTQEVLDDGSTEESGGGVPAG